MKNTDQKYQEALDFLYSFIDYSLKRNFRNSPEKFDLDRMRDFMSHLDNPQDDYQIIHVAGTKGKGSVSAMCESILRAEGYVTGLYTSPHMVEFTERIRVNGANIPKDAMVEVVEAIKPITRKIPEITTFELTTALAFLYFSLKKVQYAVIEVGLGGRLDATNIVDPLISVITSISYDHIQILGNTLSEIAGEKGGIIKPNKPVVVSPQEEEAQLKIEKIAQERHSPLVQVGRDYLYSAEAHDLAGQSFLISTQTELRQMKAVMEPSGNVVGSPSRFRIPLLGLHQVENAATAFAVLQTAEKLGLSLSNYAYVEGFAKVYWPGRMEIISIDPPIVIDSAHNQNSALRLRQAMDDYFPGMPILLILGASEDKDIEGMFLELLPRVQKVITTQSIHPRAIDAEKLVEILQHCDYSAQAITPVEEAFKQAMTDVGEGTVILITGSIFIAAAAREVIPELLND